MHFLPKKHCFWPKKALFLPKDLQKVRKSRQILICDKIAYVQALNFRPIPNFSAGATRAPAQLLPPWIWAKFIFSQGVHNSKQEAAAREKEKELEKEQKSRKESRRNSVLPKDLDTLDDSDFFSRSSTSGFGSDLSRRETLQLLGELWFHPLSRSHSTKRRNNRYYVRIVHLSPLRDPLFFSEDILNSTKVLIYLILMRIGVVSNNSEPIIIMLH